MTVVQRPQMQPINETLSHPATSDIELGTALHALSDAVRLSIVLAVADCADCATGGSAGPVRDAPWRQHLHALSDEVRLSIVLAVADGGECAMGGIDVPVSKSTCTHHFKVLRDAGVIRQRQVGTARLNTLRAEELNERFPGLLDSVLSAARA